MTSHDVGEETLCSSKTVVLTSRELETFRSAFAHNGECQSLCVLYFTRALMTPLRRYCSHLNVIPFVSGYTLEVKEQCFCPAVTIHWRKTESRGTSSLTLDVRSEFPDGRVWVTGNIAFALVTGEAAW